MFDLLGVEERASLPELQCPQFRTDILEGLLPIQGFGSVGGFAFDRGVSSDYSTAGTEGTINQVQRDGKKKGFVRVAVHK